jgi:hypothetical protein
MDEPTKLTRIDQISHKSSLTSFENKNDNVHARILGLLFNDSVTDISASTRRGIANNIHFLVMRDMHDAVAAQRITPDEIQLLYDYNILEKLYRARVVVSDITVEGGTFATGEVSIYGSWVKDRSQALDSLRLTVEAAIHGN